LDKDISWNEPFTTASALKTGAARWTRATISEDDFGRRVEWNRN
jgi:hypothetical protein